MMTKWLKDGTVQKFYNDVVAGKQELTYNIMSDYVRLYEKMKKEREILVRYDRAIHLLYKQSNNLGYNSSKCNSETKVNW